MSRDKPKNWLGKLFGNSANSANDPVLDEDAQELVDNALAFDRLRVEDVMVPRADIRAVEADAGLTELTSLFIEAGHSRLPVFRGNLDDPVGMVHVKDILPLLLPLEEKDQRASAIASQIMRDVLYVPASMDADDLLLRMQNTRVHMALVVDEYGGIDGLVTMEDLVEQIVGDIEDEHDTLANVLLQKGDQEWEASARAPIEELETATRARFRFEQGIDEVDTLGGLVFTMAGRVPAAGEVLQHENGYEFEIKKADPRKILSLTIRKTNTDPKGG